jgi:hypothetical protein
MGVARRIRRPKRRSIEVAVSLLALPQLAARHATTK